MFMGRKTLKIFIFRVSLSLLFFSSFNWLYQKELWERDGKKCVWLLIKTLWNSRFHFKKLWKRFFFLHVTNELNFITVLTLFIGVTLWLIVFHFIWCLWAFFFCMRYPEWKSNFDIADQRSRWSVEIFCLGNKRTTH